MTINNTFRIFAIGILASVFSIANYAQTFVPVNVSGFNHDLIANGSGGTNRAEASSSITFDDPANGTTSDNVLYSQNFRGNLNPSTPPPLGLPDDGIIPSLNLPGAVYHLASFDQNNALLLRTQGSSGTLTLETPGVFSKIAFLGASSNGDSDFDFVLNFSDGTSFSTTFTVPDWFFGPNFAIKSIGRVYRTTLGIHEADEFNGDSENPRLYDNQLTLDPPYDTKILTSITITKTSSNGSTGIFAINGITAINAPDAVVATDASNITINSFTAHWSSVAAATEYFLDVSESPTFSTLLPDYNNLNVGNNLSWDVAGLSNGITHYFRVRAANVSGVSPSSNTITVDLQKCPFGDVIVSDQSEVDSFIINYPYCTMLPNKLVIQNASIVDLTPFSNIVNIGGDLDVLFTSLNNLNGLDFIQQLGGRLVIYNNNALLNLNTLANLGKINGIISIDGNIVLNDISGITNIDSSGVTELYIQSNPALTVCEYDFVCNFLESAKLRNIANNAGKCADEQSVVDACELKSLKDGEYCTNAINLSALTGFPVGETHEAGVFTTEAYNKKDDPDFGQQCLKGNPTIWFSFQGDGFRYIINSKECDSIFISDPNAALYSGTCGLLTPIACHDDISQSGNDANRNFSFELQTEPGVTYYLMVEVSSTFDSLTFFDFGYVCLEFTKIDNPCLVDVPDPAFLNYLLSNPDINTNLDNQLECFEAEQYTGSINCDFQSISDLTGIDAFKNITGLDCSNNSLTKLNLSSNTKITQLNCSSNKITSLILNGNSELGSLDCSNNLLQTLDLKNNSTVFELKCINNQISSLDLSDLADLVILACNDNNLNFLNIQNGKNTSMEAINTQNNPFLSCIQVDDADYSNSQWIADPFIFDAQHEFSENCTPCQNPEEIKANFLFAATACAGEKVRIIEYGIFTSIADSVTFRWEFGDGQTSTERDPIVIYANPGTYQVSLFIEDVKCPLKITKEIAVLSCRIIPGDGNQFTTIFPNPSYGNLQLKADYPSDGDVLVNVYSLDQRKLFSKYYPVVGKLDVSIFLPYRGIVIVEFVHPSGIEKHKVILTD